MESNSDPFLLEILSWPDSPIGLSEDNAKKLLFLVQPYRAVRSGSFAGWGVNPSTSLSDKDVEVRYEHLSPVPGRGTSPSSLL